MEIKAREKFATGSMGNEAMLRSKNLVGARGFEPPTTSPPAKCATRLRYAPIVQL